MSTNDGAGAETVMKKFFLRSIAALCILFVVILAAAGFFLKRGIHLERLTIGPAVVSECDLVWNKKLELQIGSISVTKKDRDPSSKTDFKVVADSLYTSRKFARFFSFVNIKDFSFGGQRVKVKLLRNDATHYLLSLVTDQVDFQARLVFLSDKLVADIVKFDSRQFNSRATGQAILAKDIDQLTGTLSAIINGSFPVSVEFTGDGERLSFSGTEAGPIHEISPLVDLFGLSHNIQRWITDYLSGSRYHLQSFKGTLPWDNPKELLSTLEAEVRVDDTEYTFAPGLEPIKARYTDVYFQQGVLIIKPHDATFYGQDGGESWLDINFNNPSNILLTAYIKTRAVANDDILTLLGYYNIHLPFKQVEGKTAADLQLAIVLNRINVEAQGVFEIDEGAIEWDGKKFQTDDARIELVNSDLAIERLKIGYADIFSARVTGNIQARDNTGALDISVDKVILKQKEPRVSLDSSAPAKVRYRFGPDGHFLEAEPSYWLLDSNMIKLGTLQGPVYPGDLAMDVSSVRLAVSAGIISEISGHISLSSKRVDLACDLLEYHVRDLQLTSSHLPIDIKYDNGLVIRTEETSLWGMNQMPVMLYPSELSYHNNVITVNRSRISYGSLFDSHLSGYYSTDQKKGAFSLEDIDVTGKNLENKLEFGSNADVEVVGTGGKFVVYFPQFDLTVTTDEQKNWSAVLGDLSAIYSRSEILKKYRIEEGSLSVSSEHGRKPYHFSADIKLPYPLLVGEGGPVDQVQVNGRIVDAGVFATVNEHLDFVYRKSGLTLRSRKTGYNLNAILELFREHKPADVAAGDEPENKQSFFVDLRAEGGQIYLSPQSRLLADSIILQLEDGKISAKLEHGPGQMVLQLDNDTFLLEGSDLNDEFMGAMIKNSRFQGGRMSMASMGSFEDYSIVFELHDTNISGLAMVNNVMAFLNTVPAIMTLSLPEYNTRGLPIDSAIAGVRVKQKVAKFESLVVKGPELQAVGTGQMDFVGKLVDMDVRLKTQASTNVGKIPLLGYVLAGEAEDASVSLKISGGFDDPEVTNTLIEDIVVYPVEILFRTLKLPFHLFEQFSDQPDQEAEESDTEPEKTQTEEISIQDG